MRKFFANMTIRGSLLWVLAFFSFMLVIGAALGVLSLRVSNQTLAEIKQAQELDDAVSRVVGSYKDTLNSLGRAATSNYGDIVRNIRDHYQWIGHFHTGGNPGRHDIDETQELNYPFIAKAIADLGFTGFITHEYSPEQGHDPIATLEKAMNLVDV